jgi:hypothetical protein
VIAARRVFETVGRRRRRVVLTIQVPERVGSSEWTCRVRIQGLGGAWERPRAIHGIDALQALQLAVQVAQVALEQSASRLAWLGAPGDLGLPRFIPSLPPPYRARVNAAIDREQRRYAAAQRRRRGQTAARPGKKT